MNIAPAPAAVANWRGAPACVQFGIIAPRAPYARIEAMRPRGLFASGPDRAPRHHPPRSNTGRVSRRIRVGFAVEHSDCAPIPGSALTTGEPAGRPNGALHEDQEVSHASAEPSAAHTVELWESVRHTAGFGRGVVRISEIPALAAEMSHASAEPSAAHTVELWESIRHTAGFGRGVVRISEIPALAAVQFAMLAHSKTSPQRGSDTVQRVVEPPNVIGALDRGTEETSLVTRQRGEQVPQLISRDVSGARGLLDRKDLLQLLDRALTKRVTVISAPPGSGKTSLLRAWADRSTNLRRVAFVSVERDQQNEQRFWCAVLDAIRSRGALD